MATFLALLSLLLVILGLVGAYFSALSPWLGAGIVMAGMALLSLLFIITVVQMFRRTSPSGLAFVLGALSTGAFLYFAYLAYLNPLRDVSTDTRSPPEFLYPAYSFRVDKGAEYLDPAFRINRAYDPSTAVTQLRIYPDIETITVKAAPAEVFAAAVEAVNTQLPRWRLVMKDEKALHVEWQVEDPVFHSVSDVVLVTHANPKLPYEATVDLRSRFRYGPTDFGLGVGRLRDLKLLLQVRWSPLEAKYASLRPTAPPPPPSLPTNFVPPAPPPPEKSHE